MTMVKGPWAFQEAIEYSHAQFRISSGKWIETPYLSGILYL